jgi:hypothetical protein
MNFSGTGTLKFPPSALLSTVTRFTEGLLGNNFHHLFGPRDTFHDFAR